MSLNKAQKLSPKIEEKYEENIKQLRNANNMLKNDVEKYKNMIEMYKNQLKVATDIRETKNCN